MEPSHIGFVFNFFLSSDFCVLSSAVRNWLCFAFFTPQMCGSLIPMSFIGMGMVNVVFQIVSPGRYGYARTSPGAKYGMLMFRYNF